MSLLHLSSTERRVALPFSGLRSLYHREGWGASFIAIFSLIGFALSFFGIIFAFHLPQWHSLGSCLGVLFFSFSHVNIFHLLINLVFLVRFRPRISTCIEAYIVAVITAILCSYLNSALLSLISSFEAVHGFASLDSLTSPTCGLSVFLFAAFARRYVAWHKSVLPVILSNIPLFVINAITGTAYFSVLSHLISFFLSYFIWQIIYSRRRP